MGVDREGHAGALTEARNQRVEALRRNRTATLRAEHVGAGRLLALQPTKRPQLVALNWMDARRPALASPHMQPPGVERADASDHTAGTPAHPLTYDAAACTDHRHDNGATGDKLQIERARIQPHHAQPRKAQVEVKYRAHRLSNTCLRISSRTSSAIVRWSSIVLAQRLPIPVITHALRRCQQGSDFDLSTMMRTEMF